MANELSADLLQRSLDGLKMHLKDLSDADLFVRPVPTANNAAWQIGHLIRSEANMVNSVAPNTVELPAGWAERFSPDASKTDDPTKLASKAELIETASKVRAQVINWVKTLTPEDLAKRTGERLQGFAPTVGHLLYMIPVHAALHIGQIQVLRRKLGKPNLF